MCVGLYRREWGRRGRGGGAYGKPQTHIGLKAREARICEGGGGEEKGEEGLRENGIAEIQATRPPTGILETA